MRQRLVGCWGKAPTRARDRVSFGAELRQKPSTLGGGELKKVSGGHFFQEGDLHERSPLAVAKTSFNQAACGLTGSVRQGIAQLYAFDEEKPKRLFEKANERFFFNRVEEKSFRADKRCRLTPTDLEWGLSQRKRSLCVPPYPFGWTLPSVSEAYACSHTPSVTSPYISVR